MGTKTNLPRMHLRSVYAMEHDDHTAFSSLIIYRIDAINAVAFIIFGALGGRAFTREWCLLESGGYSFCQKLIGTFIYICLRNLYLYVVHARLANHQVLRSACASFSRTISLLFSSSFWSKTMNRSC